MLLDIKESTTLGKQNNETTKKRSYTGQERGSRWRSFFELFFTRGAAGEGQTEGMLNVFVDTTARESQTPRDPTRLALVEMLVALVEVSLDTVPIVDLDVVSDLRHGHTDGLERPVLRRLHHAHLLSP